MFVGVGFEMKEIRVLMCVAFFILFDDAGQ